MKVKRSSSNNNPVGILCQACEAVLVVIQRTATKNAAWVSMLGVFMHMKCAQNYSGFLSSMSTEQTGQFTVFKEFYFRKSAFFGVCIIHPHIKFSIIVFMLKYTLDIAEINMWHEAIFYMVSRADHCQAGKIFSRNIPSPPKLFSLLRNFKICSLK